MIKNCTKQWRNNMLHTEVEAETEAECQARAQSDCPSFSERDWSECQPLHESQAWFRCCCFCSAEPAPTFFSSAIIILIQYSAFPSSIGGPSLRPRSSSLLLRPDPLLPIALVPARHPSRRRPFPPSPSIPSQWPLQQKWCACQFN